MRCISINLTQTGLMKFCWCYTKNINDWIKQKNNTVKITVLFKNHLDASDLSLLRKESHYCQAVYDDRFKVAIEKKYEISRVQPGRGKPNLKKDEVDIFSPSIPF